MSMPMMSKSALGAPRELSETKATERYLCFGQFQVDLQREELLKEGSRVHIPSKVFQVLLAAPQLNLLESKKSSIAENQPQACDSDRVFV